MLYTGRSVDLWGGYLCPPQLAPLSAEYSVLRFAISLIGLHFKERPARLRQGGTCHRLTVSPMSKLSLSGVTSVNLIICELIGAFELISYNECNYGVWLGLCIKFSDCQQLLTTFKWPYQLFLQ